MTIREAMRLHEQRLMQLANVVGVGVGERGGVPVVCVLVRVKRPIGDLDPRDVVPECIEEYPTDVREIGEPISHP